MSDNITEEDGSQNSDNDIDLRFPPRPTASCTIRDSNTPQASCCSNGIPSISENGQQNNIRSSLEIQFSTDVFANLRSRFDSYSYPENRQIVDPMRCLLFALAGFRFLNDRTDTWTSCNRCQIKFCGWQDAHDPLIIHAFFSPNCEYLKVQCGAPFMETMMIFFDELRFDQVKRTSFLDVQEWMTDSRTVPLDRRNSYLRMNLSVRTAMAQGSIFDIERILEAGQESGVQPNEELVSCFFCKRKVEVVFRPCGHARSCTDHSFAMEICSACGREIEERQRIT